MSRSEAEAIERELSPPFAVARPGELKLASRVQLAP